MPDVMLNGLTDLLIKWRAVPLAGVFLKCSIQSLADLRYVALGYASYIYSRVFRAAIGLETGDPNDLSLRAMLKSIGCCDEHTPGE